MNSFVRYDPGASTQRSKSSGWLDLVVRWFAELTSRKLRSSAHRSVTELETGIRKWINECYIAKREETAR
jgi:hypothetical protein